MKKPISQTQFLNTSGIRIVICAVLFLLGDISFAGSLKLTGKSQEDNKSIPAQTQQGIRITGKVLDEEGKPLPGASILLAGSMTGAMSETDGSYAINVPSTESTLEFSYVGYIKQQIRVGTRTVINVQLVMQYNSISDVVVVGYATEQKALLTGSIDVVSSDAIRDIPVMNIDNLMQGQASGVQVTQNSGTPGGATSVRIRGVNSISGSNQPLYVIDGIPVVTGDYGQVGYEGQGINAISDLNPNDIESISILKDAAAASIYGARASNGVIVITTKRGANQKTQVSLNSYYGVQQVWRTLDMLDARGWMEYRNDLAGTPVFSQEQMENITIDTDWQDIIFRTAPNANYELTANGGNENTKFFLSGDYFTQDGILIGTDYQRLNGRVNIDHNLTEKFTVGASVGLTYAKTNRVEGDQTLHGPLPNGISTPAIYPVYNEDGSYNLNIPENSYANPRATADYDSQWEKQYKLNGNAYLEYNIIKGLTAKTTNGIELTDGEGMRLWTPEANYGYETGILQVSRTKYLLLTTSNTLNFNKEFSQHSLSLVAGQEASRFDYNEYYIYSPGVDRNIPFPNTATAEDDDADYYESAYSILSFFGVANYNFNSKYYLQASLRTDGSSRFGEKNKWGTFWSVGASWNIHNESFMENVDFINMLKLRGSYGISGNFNIGNYDQYGLYTPAEYNGSSVMIPDQPANPELGWENNSEYNAGFDFALFDRITGSFDVYSRKTTDMLLDYPLSYTSGFSSIKSNIGSIKNAGFEFLIDGSIIAGNDFDWSAGFNISHNKSEILDLGKDEQFVPTANTRLLHKVGERLYSFYLYDYAGVNPANGDAMWYNEDGELTNMYSEARRIIAGSPEPKLTGGFNTSVSYKGLTLDANFEYKYGNLIMLTENRYANSDGFSWPNNYANTQLDYWTTPGQIARNPKPVANNVSASSSSLSTRWLYDGSYLRVKNLTLSYSLPRAVTSKLKMQNLRVYASAVNLYTFHKVDFWDPERGVEGSGAGIYPQTKKIIGGIEVSF